MIKQTLKLAFCLVALTCSPLSAVAADRSPDFESPAESYWIVKTLGSGAFGKVYEVEDSRGEHYALKTLLHRQMIDMDQKANQLFNDLAREFERGQQLDHPNIIKTIDYQPASDQRQPEFMVMELVEGQMLMSMPTKSLSLIQLVRVLNEFMNVLRYAHSNGVYYLDLHEGNIMITKDKHLKMVDLAGYMTAEELQLIMSQALEMADIPALELLDAAQLAEFKQLVGKQFGARLIQSIDGVAKSIIDCSKASKKNKELLYNAVTTQLDDARNRMKIEHLTGEVPGRYKLVINRLAKALQENRGKNELDKKAFKKLS